MRVRHYVTTAGRAPVQEFILSLPVATVAEVQHATLMLAEGMTLGMPLSRPMTGIHPGLHELRLRDAAGQIRIFYYLKKGDAIYFIHAFRKKSRETPQKEIDLVSKRIKEINQ